MVVLYDFRFSQVHIDATCMWSFRLYLRYSKIYLSFTNLIFLSCTAAHKQICHECSRSATQRNDLTIFINKPDQIW